MLLLSRLLLPLLLVSLALPANGQDSGSLPELTTHDLSHQLLREPAEFLLTNTELPFAEIQRKPFSPLTSDQVNQGITGGTYWLRFRLSNALGTTERRWVLHHETSYLDNMTVYYSDNGGKFQAVHLSDRKPFFERPLTYRTLAFPHGTPAGGYTDVYLKLGYEKADSVSLNVHLSEASHFAVRTQAEYIVHGVYFGIMATLLVIAIICALLLRQIVYFHYALFLLCSTLMWALINGFAYQYLWPASVFWHNEGFHIVYLLTAVTALQFSKRFLKTRDNFPRVNQAFTALQGVMLGGIGLRFLGFYGPILALSFASLSFLVVLPVLGVMAWRRGQVYARWYALAWLVYSIGLTLSVLSAATPLFSWGMDPLMFAQAGGVLECVFLLVALGERLLMWERDRRHAMALAHQDPLTGLNNRRVLPRALQGYKDKFEANGLPVYLIMIDLDHFKELNDTYGHDAGDQVLREMGILLLRLCRPNDTCIRYGGEEFAIMVQAPSETVALQIAERIRTEFASNPTRYREHTIEHTLTAGLAPILSDDYKVSVEDIIIEADAALYRAKSEGRDRIVWFRAPASV